MYCTLKLCVLLCTIPLIKTVKLKVDGLINLGDNWSYEYRIQRADDHAKYTRQKKDDETERMRKEEQRLNKAEQWLRKEAEKKRKEVDKELDQKTKERKRPNTRFKKVNRNNSSQSFNVRHGSSTEENDSRDTPKGTVVIYDETTMKIKKGLRYISEQDYSKTRESSETQDSAEQSKSLDRSRSWIDETRQNARNTDSTSTSDDSDLEKETVIQRTPEEWLNETSDTASNKTIRNKILNKSIPTAPSAVTTVRTDNIYTEAHTVKDDAKITDFTNRLYKQTLMIFDVVKQKMNQDHLKKQIDRLSLSYEDKFKEYLRDTSSQKIKTRLGTQKVILNTIDMSNRILRRLMNFMVGDMEKKGVLRQNAATANIFLKAIETEEKLQLVHACKKFGICRTGPGFSAFLSDISVILLKCDKEKFKQSIDAITEIGKNLNYHTFLQPHTARKLKTAMEKLEVLDTYRTKAMLVILKNAIALKNKPMVINHHNSRLHMVNATLAFFELMDFLDTTIPRNESNTLEWADIKNSLEEYVLGSRYDVQDIIASFMKHLRKNLRALDKKSRAIINKNLDIILAVV